MNLHTSNHRRREAGSAILLGLVVVSMATFGLAAWVSLISARSLYLEGAEVAVKARIGELNTRAVTKEALYSTVLTQPNSSGGTLVVSNNVGDVDATITVPNSTVAPLESTSLPGGVARTGFANGYGYHIELPVATSLNIDHDLDPVTTALPRTSTRDYFLKSRSPALAGDLFVLHRPTISPTQTNYIRGNVLIYGNTVLWAASSPHWVQNRVKTERFTSYTQPNPAGAIKIKDLDNDWVPPSNFALVPTTGGAVGSNGGYDGTLNVIDPAGASWSVKNKVLSESYIALDGDVDFDSGRGAKSDGSGTIDITLDSIHLTHVVVQGSGIDEVNLHGQDNDGDFTAANLRGAITIIVHETAGSGGNLRLNFHGRNNRRIILAIKKDTGNRRTDYAFMDADTNPSWRMILLSENSRMFIDEVGSNGQPNGTVTIYGGIRTDRYFRWSQNNSKVLEIRREMDPKLLERLDARTAWVESYAN